MKKIASLAASLAIAGTSLLAGPADAGTGGPYPGTVDTTCVAHALNSPRAGHPARVAFKVRTGGNGAAHGQVTFSYQRKSNHVVVDQFVRRYQGPGRTKYRFDGIPRGKYVVRVFFDSRPSDSVYQNCRTHFSQTIRPRR